MAIIIVFALVLALAFGMEHKPTTTTKATTTAPQKGEAWRAPREGTVDGVHVCNEALRKAHCWEGGHDKKMSAVLGMRDDGQDGVFADLRSLPHLLVGGTAGSGKSVGIRGMLVSLLSKATPDDLKLAIVDPKMVDYMWTDGLPHRIAYTTSVPDSSRMLLNMQKLMEERYAIMQSERVDHWDRIPNNEDPAHIVIVIDEFASLMDNNGKKALLPAINDIAQKGRAAGFHLIIATQRPDAKVFDSRLKANCLGRVAFKCRNFRDSVTILDARGAEELRGNGDGLYDDGTGKLKRFQAPYVTVEDAERMTRYWASPLSRVRS